MLENITTREKLKWMDPPATKQAHPTISPEIVHSLVIYCECEQHFELHKAIILLVIPYLTAGTFPFQRGSSTVSLLYHFDGYSKGMMSHVLYPYLFKKVTENRYSV